MTCLDCSDPSTGVYICQNLANWSFWVLLLSSVKQDRATFLLRLISPITEAKLFQIFYPILHEIWDFPLWLLGKRIILGPCQLRGMIPLLLFPPLASGLLLTSVCWLILSWRLRQNLCKSPELCLCFSSLSSRLHPFWFPHILCPITSAQCDHRAPRGGDPPVEAKSRNSGVQGLLVQVPPLALWWFNCSAFPACILLMLRKRFSILLHPYTTLYSLPDSGFAALQVLLCV